MITPCGRLFRSPLISTKLLSAICGSLRVSFIYHHTCAIKMTEKRLGDNKLDKTVFFCCDMQEKFRPAIKYFDEILQVSQRMVKAATVLDIPLIVTEQYPKGLGSTVPELDVSHGHVFPKTKFTMVLPEVEEKMKTLCSGDVKHIVLFGIETHVCVQQTVIDLLARDYEVHVVADACSSRSQMNRLFALDRFRHSGAIVTTSEAVLLQLVADKDHPKFKEVQGIIRELGPESGLGSHL